MLKSGGWLSWSSLLWNRSVCLRQHLLKCQIHPYFVSVLVGNLRGGLDCCCHAFSNYSKGSTHTLQSEGSPQTNYSQVQQHFLFYSVQHWKGGGGGQGAGSIQLLLLTPILTLTVLLKSSLVTQPIKNWLPDRSRKKSLLKLKSQPFTWSFIHFKPYICPTTIKNKQNNANSCVLTVH